jgi:tRNA pseudouridine55 synthase
MSPNGILLLDKPAGLTSHDLVDRLRKALGIKAVGHAGTLDPQATGLMVMALGSATRWLEHLESGKAYLASLRLGLETSTEDIWGEVISTSEGPWPEPEALRQALEGLVSVTEQVPPMVSAVKQDGQRLYQMARQGKVVERKPRHVRIHSVKVLALRGQEADFEVACSAGTYVRTLCVEAGRRLGCKAALSALRRTASGAFKAQAALSLGAFEADPQAALGRLLGHEQALGHLRSLVVGAAELGRLKHGASIGPAAELGLADPLPAAATPLRLVSSEGRLLALARYQADGMLHPDKVFIDEGL